MDLRSGYPYYFLKNGLYKDYDLLRSDLTTDVVVLGGGISGALVARQLVKEGIQCAVVDKRKIALGSTSASTSLLQYEIDVPLFELIKLIGEEKAVSAYRLCDQALDTLSQVAGEIGYPDFHFFSSLYFSHTMRRNRFLEQEYKARETHGFEVRYLQSEELRSRFRLRSGEAILSKRAAVIDAYLFTQFLHADTLRRGGKVIEGCCITEIKESTESVELVSQEGYRIRAKKLVYATGYEVTEQISKSIVKLQDTYAMVTQRIPDLPDLFRQHILWNTDVPYLYIRRDEDRLIIGGHDERGHNPGKRDRILGKKAKKLEDDFNSFFPELRVKTEFAWAGTFGSTKDGLPYIGEYHAKPSSYFALGFGGNGITFSTIAADLITASIGKNTNAVPDFFRFDR